jgi:dipeptidyl aminopeptidase/acylaminoacyl peptidase
MGGSYGGYATLAGLTFTPDLYACGVDIVGPSNLKTLLASIPPYWSTIRKTFDVRMGDVDRDSVFNHKVSPLFHVDKIRKPLLIGQGQNDPRVNVRESDQIVAAMRAKNLPVEYVVYSDEGHGFARPENRMDFYGRAEGFLAKHLGGRAEPFVKGSAAQVIAAPGGRRAEGARRPAGPGRIRRPAPTMRPIVQPADSCVILFGN